MADYPVRRDMDFLIRLIVELPPRWQPRWPRSWGEIPSLPHVLGSKSRLRVVELLNQMLWGGALGPTRNLVELW